VLETSRALLEEMVTVGLAHLSPSVKDRLVTLGISALGVNLPRLSLALKSLSNEVDSVLRRDAQADDARLFTAAARTYALCSALLGSPEPLPAELVGRHRSKYDVVGKLELCGVAAYPWATKSGYRGLTLLFWDEAARRWYSFSDSRPAQRDPFFNPVSRYTQDLPWKGAASARQMSRSRFQLLRALRNDAGRLSASDKVQAMITGDTDPAAIDFGTRAFTSWLELRRYLASIQGGGLRQREALDDIVVVKPAEWGQRTFLQIEQAQVVELLDQHGLSLTLYLPFDKLSSKAIELLEKLDPQKENVFALIGRIALEGADIRLFPLALLKNQGLDRVQNIFLDGAMPEDAAASSAAATPVATASTGNSEDEESEDDFDAVEPATTELAFGLESHWDGLEDELQRLAECGRRSAANEAAKLTERARKLRERGFAPLANCLGQLATSSLGPDALLRGKYLCLCYREVGVKMLLDPGGAPAVHIAQKEAAEAEEVPAPTGPN
jgi:hypothetical protein